MTSSKAGRTFFIISSALTLAGCPEVKLDLGQPLSASSLKEIAVEGCILLKDASPFNETKVAQLLHIAEGNSYEAIYSRFGVPFSQCGDVDYYQMENNPQTLIGVHYDASDRYLGYTILPVEISE
jgi:hypothetical protein